MFKTITIKKLKSLFLTSVKIVNGNPLIYAISLFIPLIFIRILHNSIPRILYLIPMYVMIGWGGTQADLIYQAYQKKDIKWNKVERLLFKYFKKTLPVFLIFILIALLSIVLTVLSFVLKIVTGVDFSYVELSNNILIPSDAITFHILTFIFRFISIFFVQAIIQMVITQKNLLIASKDSIKYFFTNIIFFLVLSVIMFIFTSFITFIISFNTIEAVNTVLIISINAYTNLLLLTTVLIHYLQDKKTT